MMKLLVRFGSKRDKVTHHHCDRITGTRHHARRVAFRLRKIRTTLQNT
jgi:hypothetical protein